MDIRCRKTSCKFNNKQTCQAKGILVDKKIMCSTFEKQEGKPEIDRSKLIFADAPEFARQRDVKTMKIACETDCIFNHDGKCEANGITINALIEPYCITYLQR